MTDVFAPAFNLPREGFESDLETDAEDPEAVLPRRWSRQWVGPGDWGADHNGVPVKLSDVQDVFRWVAKKRAYMTIDDGSSVAGRWWNKYMTLSSKRGTMGRDLTFQEGKVLYHRELIVHWV